MEDDRQAREEEADADPHDGRDETESERMDRNWNELLQELRVTQTATQILFGFCSRSLFSNALEILTEPSASFTSFWSVSRP